MGRTAPVRIIHSILASLLCLPGLAGLPVEARQTGTEAVDAVHLTFPHAAVVNVNTIYLPFTLIGQLIAMQGRIDTLEGSFILDTGAEGLLLNTRHFSPDRTAQSLAAVGNTGQVARVVRQDFDSLHLSQLTLTNLRADLIDLSHLELKKNTRILGILGYSVYHDFEIFIDFPNRRIVLSRVDKRGDRVDRLRGHERPVDSLGFFLTGHAILVSTTVNEVRLEMILDTGAELNLLDRRVRRKVLDKFTIVKRVNLTGVGQREVEVLAGVLEDVWCGSQQTPRMNTLLTSMDEINAVFGTTADGVLGYEFLHARRVLINYQKQKLYFFGPVRP